MRLQNLKVQELSRQQTQKVEGGLVAKAFVGMANQVLEALIEKGVVKIPPQSHNPF